MSDKNHAFDAALRAALPSRLFVDSEPRYLEEPRGFIKGRAGWVLRPQSVQEVSKILALANHHTIPVIPYGGGTGLVGGQVSAETAPPLVLSLENMRQTRQINGFDNTMIVEAGVILSDIHDAAQDIDRLYPLSIAAKGSAQIGGILATNAGGVNVLRYGNARDLCLGLEVVLPDGQIYNGLSRLRKDNSGYDLRHLFIGAEGSLGVITAATLRLVPRPLHEATALMIVQDPQKALALLSRARSCMGDAISAFELIDGQGLHFLRETLPEIAIPFDDIPAWSVLIDIGLSAAGVPQDVLERMFADGFAAGEVADGVIAASEAQRHALWQIRENIPQANRKVGAIASHDISLPLSELPDFIDAARPLVREAGPLRINCFGHLGDGNLHFNVFPPKGQCAADWAKEKPGITARLYDLVHHYEGSVSAEHGVGRLKVAALERYGDPTKLRVMRQIKNALDPKGIMNPGAVLRANQ